MFKLSIVLAENFSGDTVRIQLNGREIYNREHVSTSKKHGMADSFEVEVPESGPLTLSIAIPTRNRSKTISLSMGRPLWIQLSLDPQGQIEETIHKEPAGHA